MADPHHATHGHAHGPGHAHGHAHGPAQAPVEGAVPEAMSDAARGQSDELVAAAAPPPGVPYTIARGDTLGAIAAAQLGDARRWTEIYAANRAAIGPNPNLIHVGTRILIPGAAAAGDRGATPEVDAGRVTDPGPVPPADPPPEPAVCGEPEFPAVTLRSGDATVASALATDRAAAQAAAARWGQPFDPAWISLHTFAPGVVGVVLAWQAAWGPETVTQDYNGDLSPLEARLAVLAAHGSAGWSTVAAADQVRLDALLGGETNPQSALVRQGFLTLFADAGWATQPAEAQANLLTGLIDNAASRPYLAESPEAATPLPYTLTGPTLVANHPFEGVVADADRYEVEVEGTTVPLFAPHAPDAAQGTFHSVDELATAYASLPAPNRAVINTLTLNAQQNPADAYWAVEYNTPGFRSYMTAGAAGDITIYPTAGATPAQAQINSSLTHETGHTWSQQTWGSDTTAAAWQPWRDAMASDGIALSNYATASLDEDVAETVKVYGDFEGTPMHDEYRALVPARFAILDGYF